MSQNQLQMASSLEQPTDLVSNLQRNICINFFQLDFCPVANGDTIVSILPAKTVWLDDSAVFLSMLSPKRANAALPDANRGRFYIRPGSADIRLSVQKLHNLLLAPHSGVALHCFVHQFHSIEPQSICCCQRLDCIHHLCLNSLLISKVEV